MTSPAGRGARVVAGAADGRVVGDGTDGTDGRADDNGGAADVTAEGGAGAGRRVALVDPDPPQAAVATNRQTAR
jgi:hypothetical protein